jgi:signal transduction histidine kinase
VQNQQVLINLMRNSIEAMAATNGERVLTLDVRLGDGIEIEVSDSGPGVAEPDRMFEPFFTTKDGGMGMGLAICRGIVESHGGRMWAASNQPRGARIGFALPVSVADE